MNASKALIRCQAETVGIDVLLGKEPGLGRRLKTVLAAALAAHALLFIIHFPKGETAPPPPPEPLKPNLSLIHWVPTPQVRQNEDTDHVPDHRPVPPMDEIPMRPVSSENPPSPPSAGFSTRPTVIMHTPSGLPKPGIIEAFKANIMPKKISGDDPRYPAEAARAGAEGTVVLRILIDANGEVRNVEVIQASFLGMTEAAVEAVRGWKFSPAIYRGVPIAVQKIETVHFRLER